MNHKPQCVIVTGRPGAGKTTLSQHLAQQLRMPLISRDSLKEGYLNTLGVSHAQSPSNANAVVSDVFFEIVHHHLRAGISVVIEAAFQHFVWASRLAHFEAISRPCFIICTLDATIAAQRHLQRGLADEKREWFHGDERVARYRASGEVAPPEAYETPHFDLPTLHVSTQNEYTPDLKEIVRFVQKSAASTCSGLSAPKDALSSSETL